MISSFVLILSLITTHAYIQLYLKISILATSTVLRKFLQKKYEKQNNKSLYRSTINNQYPPAFIKKLKPHNTCSFHITNEADRMVYSVEKMTINKCLLYV